MDSDWLLIGIIIAAFLYFSGYKSFGLLVGILVFLIFTASVISRKPSESKSGSAILEPIIVESTRGAPYRIPERMDLMYDPKAGMTTKWEKAGKGFGRPLGKLLKGVRDSFE